MEQIITVISLWLHTLATVLLIGHYLLLGLIYLPVFEKQTGAGPLELTLQQINQRFMPWIIVSISIFIVTGIFLMLGNPQYPGFGNIFANTWALVMSVKHALVFALIGLGTWLNIILRIGAAEAARPGVSKINRIVTVKRILFAMNASGMLVLLLTSVAQAQ
jgi:uncharacterized membrane protein